MYIKKTNKKSQRKTIKYCLIIIITITVAMAN